MKCLLASLVICWTVTLFAQDWPREVVSPQGTITIYQPQIESFKGNALSARAAISITPNGADQQVFGAVWLDCRVSTDRTNRTVKLEDVKVKQIKFPNGTDEEVSKISGALEDQLPHLDLTFSLDLLLESMETAQKERENARELEVAPPKIIVMNHPAALVLIDGDPILTDVEGTSLKRVTNTPYFVVQVPSSGRFYLRGGAIWYTAGNVKGPWRTIDNPPKAVVDLSEQLVSDDHSDDQSNINDIKLKTGKIPEIVVSTEPAELIATDGPIQFSPIKGTGLLYASNTPSRLFLEIATQQYYILVSGRWYMTKALDGPWANVESKKLPTDFANIPPGSEVDDVLASVAGTVPAKEAILDAQIPQTAEVDRSTATTDVQYDGQPQFEPIENTGMEYAVNTPTAVIGVGGRYYDCDQGVWFESPSPFGPWAVCINVPEVIYTIPPRYPVYNVRYVRVYGHTPSVAYVGYTAGYTGSYVYGGTVVYGTGYLYRPWYRHNYYARPSTWGFGVRYDPWTGWSFGVSIGWGQPQGWFAYNSRTVFAGWWGPVGYRPAYRPYVGPAYRAGYQPAYHQVIASRPVASSTGGMNRSSGAIRSGAIYERGKIGVRRPTIGQAAAPTTVSPNLVQPRSSRPDTRPGTTPEPQAATTAPARGNSRIISRPSAKENNVYATPEGNVLRKTPQGWQRRDQNTWKDAGQAPAAQGVDRDSEVRQRAAERSTSYKTSPSQPAPKAQPASKAQPKRNSGTEKKKEDKKR